MIQFSADRVGIEAVWMINQNLFINLFGPGTILQLIREYIPL